MPRSDPQQLGLVRIELETISGHPLTDICDAAFETISMFLSNKKNKFTMSKYSFFAKFVSVRNINIEVSQKSTILCRHFLKSVIGNTLSTHRRRVFLSQNFLTITSRLKKKQISIKFGA